MQISRVALSLCLALLSAPASAFRAGGAVVLSSLHITSFGDSAISAENGSAVALSQVVLAHNSAGGVASGAARRRRALLSSSSGGADVCSALSSLTRPTMIKAWP